MQNPRSTFEEIALIAKALVELPGAMAPLERGGGGSGCSGGTAGVDRGVATGLDSEEEKLSPPCFQGFLKGAWWEVQISERRSEMVLRRFIELQDEKKSWVPLDCLRFHDRRCDDWECCILRTGIDVSVRGGHPAVLRPQPTMAAYDAKIVSISKSNHQLADCHCKFFVKFYSISERNCSLKHGEERVLLEDVPSKEVDISKLSILQQSGIIPLNEVLEAHMSGKWGTEQGRWSSDAYSLKETELTIPRTSRRPEDSALPSPSGDFLPDFFEEGRANSGGRQKTVNGQHSGASASNRRKLPERIVTGKRSRLEGLQKWGPVEPISKPGPKREELKEDERNSGFATTDGERENFAHSNNDNGSEMPHPTDEKGPFFEIFGNRIVEDSFSDSDCDTFSKKEPLVQKLWQEFDEEPTAVDATQGVPQPELHQSDGNLQHIIRCEHCKLVFKEDVGYVCGICGLVSIPVEDVVPHVEPLKRRRQEDNLAHWDFDRSFPSGVDQGATGQGRIQHEEEVTMLSKSLPPHYAKQMHPHQKEGFEFLWRNLAGYDAEGNLKAKYADKNAGCILSHAPGTGKTFLVVAFLKSYMDTFPSSQQLIVVPSIMLLRWKDEFAKWKSGIKVFILNSESLNVKRRTMLCKWRIHRSVCLVSYNLFSALIYDKGSKRTPEIEAIRKSLLESPRILVLDECHFPRNKQSNIRKALQQVTTHARILLSGTLFQNNFDELFNILSLARPGFGNAETSRLSCDLFSDASANKYPRKLADGHFKRVQVNEAAENKARKLFVRTIGMKIKEELLCKGSEVRHHARQRLQRLIADFVHHHTGEVLASLPGLRDFGILLKPTTFQCSLLEIVDKRFQRPAKYSKRKGVAPTTLKGEIAASATLKREIATSETCIHPQLLTKLDFVRNDPKLLKAVSQFNYLPAMVTAPGDPHDGVKTKFVFDLLSSLKSNSEKILIFSEHLAPLQMLEEMFKKAFNWDRNKDILRLDGTMGTIERDNVIIGFNNPQSQAQVLLASTKASGEGINLVGASRVVFLDVLWNPAVIKQAISRAFRLGQTKKVHVYRLVAVGTIEEKKYKKAIQKDWLSMSIFTTTARETDVQMDGQIDDDSLPPPGSVQHQRGGERMLAWEVNASTCEDGLLEELLKEDRSQTNSFFKVVEHDSQFHKRKSAGCPDARKWFLED